MIKYNVKLNNGVEALNINEKSVSAEEVVENVDAKFMAHHMHLHNALIPEDVATAVLNAFCESAAELMGQGHAVVLTSKGKAALRLYPDIHVKGGNINLKRAKELDPTVTELTAENAGALIDKAGITCRVRAVAQNPFTDLLDKEGYTLKRTAIVTKQGSQATDTHEEGGDNGGSGDNGGNDNSGGDDLEG